jgi:hypothetical protein
MYTIDVRPTSDILPRMFAVDFELHPGDPGATVIVSAAAPLCAVEKAFQLFPEYLSEGRQGRVREIECVVIDWERDRASVVERKMQKPKPQQVMKSTVSRRCCDEESCNLCQG